MRILLPLLIAATLTAPVHAQAATRSSEHAHNRLTMAQRFEQANVTHDGHLTLDQAKTGYESVARHFAAIDQDKKGFVTVDDIRAYNKAQRALHHQPSAEHHTPSS